MTDPLLIRLLIGFVINLFLGVVAFMREMVDDTGFFTGVTLFTFTYAFLDWQGYLIIIIFFFITGVSIDVENKDKADKGEFELYKAKRPIERVLGRCLAGSIFAALFFITNRPEFKLAFVASYAESAFDTTSTKLGKLLSKNAFIISSLKKVYHGTPGGVSWQGTGCGAAAALIISCSAFAVRLVRLNGLFIVLIGAFLGSFIDSFLNAYSYQKRRVPNEFINFFSSMSAGLIVAWLHWICTVILGIRC